MATERMVAREEILGILEVNQWMPSNHNKPLVSQGFLNEGYWPSQEISVEEEVKIQNSKFRIQG